MAPCEVPVMNAGLFGHSRNRAVVLRRHNQYAGGASDIVLVARNLGWEIGLKVLVEHWQVVDSNEFGLELAAGQSHKRLGELSIDGLAPVGADDDRDFRQGCWSRHFALST
jgi:hypothetical protein